MPVFPALPVVKLFRINGRLLERYLDTVAIHPPAIDSKEVR